MNVNRIITCVALIISVIAFVIGNESVNKIREEHRQELIRRNALNMMILKTGISMEEYIRQVGHRNPMFQFDEEARRTRSERLANAQWGRKVSVVGMIFSGCLLLCFIWMPTRKEAEAMMEQQIE